MARFISQVVISLTQMVLLHYLDKTVKLVQAMTVRLNQTAQLFQVIMEVSLSQTEEVQLQHQEERLMFQEEVS